MKDRLGNKLESNSKIEFTLKGEILQGYVLPEEKQFLPGSIAVRVLKNGDWQNCLAYECELRLID